MAVWHITSQLSYFFSAPEVLLNFVHALFCIGCHFSFTVAECIAQVYVTQCFYYYLRNIKGAWLSANITGHTDT